MKMKKVSKILSLTLSLLMLLSVFTACSDKPASNSTAPESSEKVSSEKTTDNDASNASTDEEPQEHVTLKWYLHGSDNVTDPSPVLDEVNKYLGEKLNVTLEPIWGTWGDFNENVILSLQGNDDVDIYFTCAWTPNEYAAFAKQGYWARLDDPNNNLIEEYGQDVWKILPSTLTDAAYVDGSDGFGVYALPGYKELGQVYTWDINVNLLEELGYTVDDVNDFYEFDQILAAAKEKMGADFYPLNVEPAVLERFVNNADIVDSNLLLTYMFDPEDPSKSGTDVVSKYESPEYKKFVEKMYEYTQKGYVDPKMGNQEQGNNARTAAQNSMSYLIGTQVYAPGYEYEVMKTRSTTSGTEAKIAMKPVQSGIVSTTPARGAMMAISTSSKNPERAMMFLNLLNTDPELFTMIAYGLEGVHYNMDDELVEFTDKRTDYQPWRNGLGNVYLLPATTDNPEEWDQYKEFNQNCVGVPLLGWSFDSKPVETEYAALSNIAKQYADPLNAGISDPATLLPEFIEKLKENNIDKVTEEANKQIAEFLSNKS